MWEKGNPCEMLVIGATTVKKSMKFPQRLKMGLP